MFGIPHVGKLADIARAAPHGTRGQSIGIRLLQQRREGDSQGLGEALKHSEGRDLLRCLQSSEIAATDARLVCPSSGRGANRGAGDRRGETGGWAPGAHTASTGAWGGGGRVRRARRGESCPWCVHLTSDHKEPLGDPECMLWGRERLTALRLTPIGFRGGATVASAAIRSPHVRLRGHRCRSRPPVEDHVHSGVRLEALAKVLVEPGHVAPHDDEPARKFGLVGHYCWHENSLALLLCSPWATALSKRRPTP